MCPESLPLSNLHIRIGLPQSVGLLSSPQQTRGTHPLTLVPATLIDPIKRMDPGLVYDMKTSEYVLFLRNIGYTGDQINQIFFALPEVTQAVHKYELQIFNINYPSITVTNFQSPIHRDDKKKRPQRGEN